MSIQKSSKSSNKIVVDITLELFCRTSMKFLKAKGYDSIFDENLIHKRKRLKKFAIFAVFTTFTSFIFMCMNVSQNLNDKGVIANVLFNSTLIIIVFAKIHVGSSFFIREKSFQSCPKTYRIQSMYEYFYLN